ncbi:ATP10 protein-domain-containing protein [Aspergillus venezuelensis]
MLKPSTLLTSFLEPSLRQSTRCLNCQPRSVSALRPQISLRTYATQNSNEQTPTPEKTPTSRQFQFEQNAKPQSFGPQHHDPRTESIPVLDRPIGSGIPPAEGQNTGVDKRSFGQRRDDFTDFKKHMERREELTRQVSKAYFRDWTNMRYNKGKTFLSNQRLFKREKSLYFPNLYGATLESPSLPQNTTSVLRGKVSVINLFSSVWAESQVATFTGPNLNPGLWDAIKEGGNLVQKVDINVEDNTLKAWLIRMFMWSMRRKMPKEQHERYFLIRKGIDDGLKQAIGMMNNKVGYVYLLDENCRIRWAGSGPARPEELEALNNGVRKLVAERRITLGSDAPVESWKTETTTGPKKARVVEHIR